MRSNHAETRSNSPDGSLKNTSPTQRRNRRIHRASVTSRPAKNLPRPVPSALSHKNTCCSWREETGPSFTSAKVGPLAACRLRAGNGAAQVPAQHSVGCFPGAVFENPSRPIERRNQTSRETAPDISNRVRFHIARPRKCRSASHGHRPGSDQQDPEQFIVLKVIGSDSRDEKLIQDRFLMK